MSETDILRVLYDEAAAATSDIADPATKTAVALTLRLVWELKDRLPPRVKDADWDAPIVRLLMDAGLVADQDSE